MPPRGSVRSCILEEMIHRERVRSWKSLMIQLSTLVAHMSKGEESIKQVGKDLSDLYDMSIHKSGSYDINSRLKDNSRSKVNEESDLSRIAKLVEGLPDV